MSNFGCSVCSIGIAVVNWHTPAWVYCTHTRVRIHIVYTSAIDMSVPSMNTLVTEHVRTYLTYVHVLLLVH